MSINSLTGQTLGQYQFREVLGMGGLGVVYRAVHATLRRDVAVKVLSTELAQSPGFSERFFREVALVAALEHEHIAPIYDYGIQAGIVFLAMPLFNGGTLSQRLIYLSSNSPLLPSFGEVSTLLKQTASALDHAHANGVIHRDVKPSNIMFDDQGKAYLVDFWTAKVLRDTSSLAATGMIIGTPIYMPPEQWRAEALSPASDQYSLGIVIYALVTGRVPFEADTPHGLMYRHHNEIPTSPHILNPEIPLGVSTAIARSLAKRPEDRFPNVMAFARAFEEAIKNVHDSPVGFFTVSIKGVQRTKLQIARGKQENASVQRSGLLSRLVSRFSSKRVPDSVHSSVGGDILSSKSYLFVSYSRQDRLAMQRMCDHLRQSGFEIWTDENLAPGTPAWEVAVSKAIENAKTLVVLMSPDAKQSLWVTREISYGEEYGIKIIPVLIRGEQTDAVPLRLVSTQRIDARHDFDTALQELVIALRQQPEQSSTTS